MFSNKRCDGNSLGLKNMKYLVQRFLHGKNDKKNIPKNDTVTL